MPEIIELTIFRFEELDDDAKAKARDWYREGAFDYAWYDFVFDDFQAICGLLGISLKTATVRLMGGGTREKPCVYFRGFWSQGDGACFEGRYRYRSGSVAAIHRHAPKDKHLHQIAEALADVQKRNFYQLTASATHSGHYYHEYGMSIDVARERPQGQDCSGSAAEAVKEALRDLARWLYGRLEAEYEYLNSEASIDAAVEANDCRFTADGRIYG